MSLKNDEAWADGFFDKIKSMSVLEKLHAVEKAKCIYNIHYCKAGVGIVFYYPDKYSGDDWKMGLSCEKYYPTFEDCINAEYEQVKNNDT